MSIIITNIASIVAVVIAVVAPITTALINNKYQFKIQQRKIKQEKLISIYEDFLDKAAKCISSDGFSSVPLTEFKKSVGKAYLYSDRKTQRKIDEFVDFVINKDPAAFDKYIELSKLLSDSLCLF